MNVEDVMTRDVKTCPWHASVNEAARMMWEQDFGVLPIIDGDGTVVGIITDRDVCMAAYTQGRPFAHISVATAMSRSVYGCKRGDSLAEAMTTMQRHQIRRLPVLDATGRIEGILSLSDLTRALFSQPLPSPRELSPEHIARTLAALSTPRQSEERTTVIDVPIGPLPTREDAQEAALKSGPTRNRRR
jgi:CBS domain-containing protein